MKKFVVSAALAILLLLTACTKESYYHTMSVLYPSGAVYVLADQPQDSLVFYTTDNFQISSNASWATIPDSMLAGTIPNAYRNVWQVKSSVFFQPNTTGTLRTAVVSVHSYGDDDWDESGSASYVQLHWLGITRPSPAYAYNNGIPSDVAFVQTDSATQVADTLKFLVYGEWTLTDGHFVHPQTFSGRPGQHTVLLTVEPNETGADRADSLMLTSRGVSSKIKFNQAKKTEK